MKTFAIYDKTVEAITPLGYLIYSEENNEYMIELNHNLDEWDAPLLFQKEVHEGNYSISNDLAYRWVTERVIPSGRQNIMDILTNTGMNEYNEIQLLSCTKGICSQDECYLEEINEPRSLKEILGG